MIKKIPAGYQVEVVSWENDADNYNTKSVYGLTLEQAKFYYKLAMLHRSKGSWSNCFGNMYEPIDGDVIKHHAAISEIIKGFPSNLFDEDEPLDSDWALELIYKIGLSSGEFYTRVCESCKVYFYPSEVNIREVTEEFV